MKATSLLLNRIVRNYIGGKYVDPVAKARGQESAYIPVITPHTGEGIAQCPVSKKEDVDLAVAAAKQAFKSWGFVARILYVFLELFLPLVCTLPTRNP